MVFELTGFDWLFEHTPGVSLFAAGLVCFGVTGFDLISFAVSFDEDPAAAPAAGGSVRAGE